MISCSIFDTDHENKGAKVVSSREKSIKTALQSMIKKQHKSTQNPIHTNWPQVKFSLHEDYIIYIFIYK